MAERNAETPESKRIVYRVGVHLGDVLIEGEEGDRRELLGVRYVLEGSVLAKSTSACGSRLNSSTQPMTAIFGRSGSIGT